MLTLAQCRAALQSDCCITDDELLRLRDQLSGIADVITILAAQRSLPRQASGDVFDDAVMMFPEDERAAMLERAAIHEFDGGVPRDVAERRVLADAVTARKKSRSRPRVR